jgi:hypothetical protein
VKRKGLAAAAILAVPVAVTAIVAPKGNTPTTPKVPDAATARIGVAVDAATLRATSLVRARRKTAGCTLGALPDRGCSPGAIDARRTAKVVCSKSFHTSDVRDVPDSLKHQVEVEYGLAPKGYGDTLEIDHIVSLELGGSNDIANLYPELAPGFHAKDSLENRLHALVCTGKMTLHTAQRRIAADWMRFYTTVIGMPPVITGDMRRKKP